MNNDDDVFVTQKWVRRCMYPVLYFFIYAQFLYMLEWLFTESALMYWGPYCTAAELKSNLAPGRRVVYKVNKESWIYVPKGMKEILWEYKI